MAYNAIGTGAVANDGTGDSLRVGAGKANTMFQELYGYSASFPQFTTSSSTTAYVGTPSPVITAYVTGQRFQVKAHATSTGSVTLNLNALGAKKVYSNPTTQATTGTLVINTIYILAYDAALDTAAGGFLIVGGTGGSGTGDVTKVGTPVNNQIGVWTGDGTIEGDAALTFDTTTDTLATQIVTVADDAYASGWNASVAVPTKNAVYDKVESMTDELELGLVQSIYNYNQR